MNQSYLIRGVEARFAFRALPHNVGIVTTAKQTLQKNSEPRFSSFYSWNPSPERIHEKLAENRCLRRSIRDKSRFASRIMSNITPQSGTQAVIYDCWT
jgi:hypothetical protein